jgi:hypothetical protein
MSVDFPTNKRDLEEKRQRIKNDLMILRILAWVGFVVILVCALGFTMELMGG